jgi:zona occludens toxin (predicted ATPase)
MTIYLYYGTVGSGKSYHALVEGLMYVNRKRKNTVVANFPIKAKTEGERKNWIYLEDIQVKDLIRISLERGIYGKEGHGLIIIDEAGVFFNARDWQVSSERRKEWIKFMSQSRKFGYNIILIAQEPRMVDRQIRSQAEYNVKHVKMRNYSWFKIIPFPVFAQVYYWSGGQFKGQVRLSILKPWIAKRYDTMKIFSYDEEMQKLIKEYGY